MYIPSVNSIMAAGLALTGMPEMLKGRKSISPSCIPLLLSLAYPLLLPWPFFRVRVDEDAGLVFELATYTPAPG